ncbi:MAG TPA: tyrosine-type recombinase/integrase [Acidimicrobiales bacterium]|nr:tyrosine-type recombinase/integrase [Acidimicrobiales bacterium]
MLERADAGLPADASAFDEHLAQLRLGDLTEANLVAAVAAFAADGHAPASVRRALSTWRGFCKWLVREGHLPANPLEEVRGPKRPDWAPKPLELAELERVVAAAASPDTRARHPWPERDLALLAALAGAGLRSGEVIAMAVGAVEATDRSPRLRVRGKGAQDPGGARGPRVTAAIAGYLDSRQVRVGRYSSTDPLFVRLVGSPERPQAQAFNRQSLDHLVLTWFRRAAVTPPPGALAHALRHTYATLLVDAGASLPEVQALLGHKDMSTTQVYLKVAGRGLEDAARAHPARQALARARTTGDGQQSAD